MALYSYQLTVDECECGVDFSEPKSLQVEGILCHIEDGNVMESETEGTYLILKYPAEDVDARCAACGKDVSEYLGHEEQEQW